MKENNQLKEILNNQDNNKIGINNINMNNNNQLNHTMFNIPINNNILNDNNSMVVDSNNNRNILNNTLNIANKRINNNYKMVTKIEDPNDDNQKKTLEEFKELLKKIDEKLDISNPPETNP